MVLARQQHVLPRADIRVTIVDGQAFTVAIRPRWPCRLDWRLDCSAEIRSATVATPEATVWGSSDVREVYAADGEVLSKLLVRKRTRADWRHTQTVARRSHVSRLSEPSCRISTGRRKRLDLAASAVDNESCRRAE